MNRRVVLVPGVLALLPEYASRHDPVAELRAACRRAVSWLGEEVRVIGAGRRAERVAEAVLADRTPDPSAAGAQSVLVVANGTATRTERAPGYFDERAEGFDAEVARALRIADAAALRKVDADLAAELWADLAVVAELADLVDGAPPAEVHLDAAPYGVQYWVMCWQVPAG